MIIKFANCKDIIVQFLSGWLSPKKEGDRMVGQLVTVTFLPEDKKVEIPVGTSLLEAVHRAGVQVNAVCGGKGSCGKCRGRVLSGNLSERSAVEKERIDGQQLANRVILLCQRKVQGHVAVEVLMPGTPGFKYTPVKGNVLEEDLDIDPSVQKYFLAQSRPTIHDQTADLDRVLAALPGPVEVETGTVTGMTDVLWETGYQATAVVVNDRLVSLEAGDTSA